MIYYTPILWDLKRNKIVCRSKVEMPPFVCPKPILLRVLKGLRLQGLCTMSTEELERLIRTNFGFKFSGK